MGRREEMSTEVRSSDFRVLGGPKAARRSFAELTSRLVEWLGSARVSSDTACDQTTRQKVGQGE